MHKSDAGGVIAGITSAAEARAAFAKILANVSHVHTDAHVEGVLVQQMIRGGRETIAGVVRDALFGPLTMFGLGGIYVEAMRDAVFRVAPLSARESADMVGGIRGARILQGMRGQAGADTVALADVVRRVAQLATDFPEIAEIDVNPLLGLPKGAVAEGARVILRER